MLILVSTSSRAKEYGAAIEHTTHQRTQIATSLARAVEFLRAHDYDALVLDESFHQAEIGAVNLLLNHAGMAMLVYYVNLALHGSERVARAVQTGLLRLVREKLAAMRTAEYVLRRELRGQLTGILLNSELACAIRHFMKQFPRKFKPFTTWPKPYGSSWRVRRRARRKRRLISRSRQIPRAQTALNGLLVGGRRGTLRYGGCGVNVVPTLQRTR